MSKKTYFGGLVVDYDEIYKEQKCKEDGCKFIYKSRRSLGNHLTRSHNKMQTKDYVLKHYFNKNIPVCLCGCGESVNWHKTEYYFSSYISGHNDSGTFSQGKFVPTKEQIEKRNDAIRKTYRGEKREEIIEKISQSVYEAFQDEKVKERHSAGLKRAWSDPEYHEKMTKKRSEVWKEQYHSLIRKIFTKEFGEKISIANMNRESQYVSKQELEFVDHLKTIFDNVVGSHWINTENRHRCYDAYLKDYRTVVEWDGTHCHGCENDDYSHYEKNIGNIRNDLLKNRLAAIENKSLIRVSSDVKIKNIKDMDSLKENAYFIANENGRIIKGSERWDIIEKIDLQTISKIIGGNIIGNTVVSDDLVILYIPLIKYAEEDQGWSKRHKIKEEVKKIRESKNAIVVYQDNLWFDEKIIRSMINNKLNIINETVGARECKIKEITRVEASKFFNNNHLYGSIISKVYFGLFYNDELMCSLALRSPVHKTEKTIEISRFATALGVRVQGGFSKLLKSAILWAKENGYESIRTYADLCFSSGSVYEKNGFSFIKETREGYWYTDCVLRYDRFRYRARDGKSEREIAEECGVYKIYGCGNYLYEMKI